MTVALADLRVDRARLANARPGDRDRLTRALAMASPAATGVSERGLLLVRKVRLDRPLGAGVEGFAGELIDRIRAAKVRARRGILGAGDSVYFESEIALEVAVVGDWLAGEALPETVRRTIRDSATPLLRWRRSILPDGRKLAVAMAALAEAGTAGQWLAHFDEGELAVAAELVRRTYGGSPARPESVAEPSRSSTRGEAEHSAISLPSAIREAVATARTVAPEGAARALLAVAILAVRRPALVAIPAFEKALRVLRQSEPVSTNRAVSRQSCGSELPVAEEPADLEKPKRRPTTARRAAIECHDPIDGRSMPRSVAVASETAEARKSTRACVAALPTTESAVLVSPIAAAVVRSEHAGLFFVLNIFLALGLYGDFTDPARGLKGLSPFELLLLLGRRWRGEALARDPVVPLLRSLAGLKPRERPGQAFDAPAWEVPADWLAPWPDSPARTFGTSDWHRCGFPLADRRQSPRPAAWVRRRWVACLGRYVEARLARALGIDDRAEALRTLIDLPGTIRIDAEQVEIDFVLDAHPLAIRLAGLDRDPGWIPSAGRSIGFRFT